MCWVESLTWLEFKIWKTRKTFGKKEEFLLYFNFSFQVRVHWIIFLVTQMLINIYMDETDLPDEAFITGKVLVTIVV